MEDCIFCKIVNKEIPAVKVYEDTLFLAFMDINPVAKGHILLIPKSHSQWIHETDDDLIAKIFILAKKLINEMKAELPCDYVQVSIVGEEVPHFHIHLIPRYFDDNLPKWKTQSYESNEEIEEYANKIKNA